jgi:hypothetical protein
MNTTKATHVAIWALSLLALLAGVLLQLRSDNSGIHSYFSQVVKVAPIARVILFIGTKRNWSNRPILPIFMTTWRIPTFVFQSHKEHNRAHGVSAHGWSAWSFVIGRPMTVAALPQVITAVQSFHHALTAFPRPEYLTDRDSPFDRADRAAWGTLPTTYRCAPVATGCPISYCATNGRAAP